MERVRSYFDFSEIDTWEKIWRIIRVSYVILIFLVTMFFGFLSGLQFLVLTLPLFIILLIKNLDHNLKNMTLQSADVDSVKQKYALLAKIKKWCFGLIPFSLLAGLIAQTTLSKPFNQIAFFAYSFVIIIGITFYQLLSLDERKQNADADYGEKILLPLLKKRFTNVTFDPEEKIDESIITNSPILPSFSLYSGKNLIQGEYENRSFRYGHVRLCKRKVRYDDNNSPEESYEEIFNGGFLLLPLQEMPAAPLQIIYRNSYSKRKQRKYFADDAVTLENEAFNNVFIVTCKNPEVAKNFLTPEVQRTLLIIDKKVDHPLNLAFLDNQLQVNLNDKDSLSVKDFKNIEKEKAAMSQYVDRLQAVIKLLVKTFN